MKDKIEYLLKDDSMPKMVLLNGAWGSGKTFWIENNLLTDDEYLYLSLNGLGSIDDFYSNLISKFFFNKNIKAEDSSSFLDGLQNILGSFNQENKGLISGLVSGFKGAAVAKAISSIKNRIIVLDDVERIVKPNLAKEIMGVCQSLSQKNDKLKFIFATNVNELKFENTHTLIEKNFSGTVEFEINEDDFFQIVKENIADIATYVVEVLNKLELRNIRILKRAKSKYLSLIEEVEKDNSINNLDVIKGRKSLFKDVVSIYYMQMGIGFDIDKIKSQARDMVTESQPNLPEIESTILVDHIVSSKSLEFEDVLKSYYPVKVLTFDLLLSRGAKVLTEIDEAQIYEYLQSLESIITNEENPELLRWFYAVDVICELDKYKFIEELAWIPTTESSLVESILKNYLPNVFDTSAPMSGRRGYRTGQFYSEELNQKFESVLDELKELKQGEKIKYLEGEILKGWTSDLDSRVYKEYRAVSLFSLFQNSNKFVQALTDHWSIQQVNLFRNFVEDRYKVNFNNSSLIEELSFLVNIQKGLFEYTQQKCGLKIGFLNQLIESLNLIINTMENSQKD
ncbi:hypothetical protein [Pseudoalteromonas sp. Z9A6]|uniref:hypothetical protein n=1 Tax=Pseudoalteromonas sp. Z9A6 TaxID=2686352 RepID=UPI0013FDCC6F|nr:hypothetical protein [Pseudoalteromonas sp. Z9A6]